MSYWQKIKFIFSQIFKFLEPFIKIFLAKSGKILAEAAMRAVVATAASYRDSDGETKRKEAFKMIKEDLERREIELGASVINAAIEAAVAKLKQ